MWYKYFLYQATWLWCLFDSFLICNVFPESTFCSIPMKDFSLNFKVFILIIIFLVFCLKNKTFFVTVRKFCPKRILDQTSWKFKFLSSFILFIICITYLLVKILLSAVLKSPNFVVSLFCTIFKYRIIATFLFFLTFDHERLFRK